MAKLVVDRVKCIRSSDASGDDLYFLVMRFDSECKVRRVGPNVSWHDIEDGSERTTDVVLVDDFSGTYLVAVIDEDDSYDFDREVRDEMSKVLRLSFQVRSMFEPDQGRLMGWMMLLFANMIGRMRTNDDLLHVQSVTGSGQMQLILGEGSRYEISLKVV